MESLIIVSNRLPFKIERKMGGYELKQSSGGLVSALLSLANKSNSVSWVGIADFKKELWNEFKNSNQSAPCDIEPIFVNKQDYQKYYNGFSNTVIWPLFHYFPSYAEYDESCFESYRKINKEFADKITGLAKPGASVWVHDYHLMLLPKYIKQRRPDLKIGFFLHIPFPSYEILKLIPAEWRNEIIDGLIHADTLGFHTDEYASHFKRSLAYFSGITINKNMILAKNHVCSIKSYPISVDFDKFNNAFDSATVARGRNNIRQRHKGLKIIFSVDRLDYTKGVINRLQAYESFLEAHADYREKVTFVINVVPSRDQITKYAERKKMIEENIGRINGLYGNMNWQPIIYQYRHLTFNQLLSFYTVADIALITPLRDGMNLVAKEFVASRKDEKGVLILSEFAGASSELRDAILVNPNDVQTMKEGLRKALNVSEEEEREKMQSMREIVSRNNVHKWTGDFIDDMTGPKSMLNNPHVITFSEKVNLFDAYRKSRKRLLLLDYDGTLSPYYLKPEDARPKTEVVNLLRELSAQPGNEVILVSGRSVNVLEDWFADAGISFVAEHGAIFKNKHVLRPTQLDINIQWQAAIENVMQKYCFEFEGSVIEKKQYSLALHYRGVESAKANELLTDLTQELNILNTDNFYKVLHGNKVLEVMPSLLDKGTFVSDWLKENQYDFIMAIGDDSTDEDMFRELKNIEYAHTLKVGIIPTQASYNLINVSKVISILSQLNEVKSIKNPELLK